MAKPLNYQLEAQQKFISYYLNNFDNTNYELEEKYLTDYKLGVIYKAIKELNPDLDDKKALDELLIGVNKLDKSITYEYLNDLKSGYTEFKNMGYVVKQIKEAYIKNDTTKTILEDILVNTTKGGDLNIEEVKNLANSLIENIQELEIDGSLVKTPQLISEYIQLVEDTHNGIFKKRTFGFNCFSTNINNLSQAGDIIVIAGLPGSGKSLMCANIIVSELIKRTPILLFSTELTKEMYFLRLLSIMTRVNTEDLENLLKQDARTQQRVRLKMLQLKDYKHFIINDDAGLNIDKVDAYIKKVKHIYREEGLFEDENEYMKVFIDIIDQIEEFSGADAYKLVTSINRLYEVAKRNNVSLIITAQLNRQVLRYKPIKELEDVDNLLFHASDIWGGTAFEMRARNVFTLKNTKDIKLKLFPDKREQIEVEDDSIIEVYLAKCNYKHKRKHFKFVIDEDSETRITELEDNHNNTKKVD